MAIVIYDGPKWDFLVDVSIDQTSPLFVSTTFELQVQTDIFVTQKVHPSFSIIYEITSIIGSQEAQSVRLTSHIQGFNLDSLVTLWTINHPTLGVLRFTNTVNEKKELLRFAGNEYAPFPIDADGFSRSSQGANTRPTLKLGAVHAEIISILISGQELQGAEVTRLRTFRQYLDDGESPSASEHFPIEYYRIERISEWVSGYSVTFELSSILDTEQAVFPFRRILRDYCSLRYRYYDIPKGRFVYSNVTPCPYTGGAYYNSQNIPVAPHLDKCAKTLKACILRFGQHSVLPFYGFPAVDTYMR